MQLQGGSASNDGKTIGLDIDFPFQPKDVHHKELQSVDVGNVNLPKCNGKLQLGRSSFVIKDNSSAR
ncbi:hypothetical protein NPIL_642871 [Nephila pilipes]|uniref:Uncharacterized protein n=1 Tax=Nephila pilipes TaxID=299642 RepID=A0A8X6PCT0_NEPPI|nr:hypothetical protein NPIL_642871 [Nephila pilipes]